MKYLGLLLIFSTGCGLNGNQQLNIGGASNSNINLVFQFINQIEDLCRMQLSTTVYATHSDYDKAVADCTFKNLSLVQIQNIQDICKNSNLTSEQQNSCNALGGVP